MTKDGAPPPQVQGAYKPQGDFDRVASAIRSALIPDSEKGRKVAHYELDDLRQPGGYKPNVTTFKSPDETVLPQHSDGTRLSWPGAKEAIERTAHAFNFENKSEPKSPKDVKSELLAIAEQTRALAETLIHFSPEAQWRLACLPSVDLWPRPSEEGRGLQFPNPSQMEPNQAEKVYPHDSRFLQLRVGELIPSLSEDAPNQSHWYKSLHELAKVIQEGADLPPGPNEKNEQKRRSNEHGGRAGYAAFLLIRECDAILCASEFIPIVDLATDASQLGGKPCMPHRNLGAFAKAMYEYATGVLPLSSLKRPLQEYLNSWKSNSQDFPNIWRAYRISSLRVKDFKDHGCDSVVSSAILEQLGYEERCNRSLAKYQVQPRAQYEQRETELKEKIKEFMLALAKSESEAVRYSLMDWISRFKEELYHLEVRLSNQEQNRAKGNAVHNPLGPDHRILPPGRTFLSGLT